MGGEEWIRKEVLNACRRGARVDLVISRTGVLELASTARAMDPILEVSARAAGCERGSSGRDGRLPAFGNSEDGRLRHR